MRRGPVNKSRSAGKFRSRASKTHKVNSMMPKRGGIRL